MESGGEKDYNGIRKGYGGNAVWIKDMTAIPMKGGAVV